MTDDFDIYEDLHDLELEAKKESKELQDLQRKLSDLEAKVLAKEQEKLAIVKKNDILLENISSLLLTAKAEIKRKDATITDLRKQCDNAAFRRGNPHGREVRRVSKYTQTTCPPQVDVGVQAAQTEDEEIVDRGRKRDGLGRYRDRERDREGALGKDRHRERDRYREPHRSRERDRDKNRKREKDLDTFHERDRHSERHHDRNHAKDRAQDRVRSRYRDRGREHRYRDPDQRSRERDEDLSRKSVQPQKKENRQSVESYGTRPKVMQAIALKDRRKEKFDDGRNMFQQETLRNENRKMTNLVHKDEGISQRIDSKIIQEHFGRIDDEPWSEKEKKLKTQDITECILAEVQAEKCREMCDADTIPVSKVHKHPDNINNNFKAGVSLSTRTTDKGYFADTVCEKTVRNSTCAAPMLENPSRDKICTSIVIAKNKDSDSNNKRQQNISSNSKPSNKSQDSLSNEIPLKNGKQKIKKGMDNYTAPLSIVPSGSNYQEHVVGGGIEPLMYNKFNTYFPLNNGEVITCCSNQSMNILEDDEETVTIEKQDVQHVVENLSELAKDENSYIKITTDVALNDTKVVGDSCSNDPQYSVRLAKVHPSSKGANVKEFQTEKQVERADTTSCSIVLIKCDNAKTKLKSKGIDQHKDSKPTNTDDSKTQFTKNIKIKERSSRTAEDRNRMGFEKDTNVTTNNDKVNKLTNENVTPEKVGQEVIEDVKKNDQRSSNDVDSSGRSKHILNNTVNTAVEEEQSIHRATNKVDYIPEKILISNKIASECLNNVPEAILISNLVPNPLAPDIKPNSSLGKESMVEMPFKDTNDTEILDNDRSKMNSGAASIASKVPKYYLNVIGPKLHQNKTVENGKPVSEEVDIKTTANSNSPSEKSQFHSAPGSNIIQGEQMVAQLSSCEGKHVDGRIGSPSVHNDTTDKSADLQFHRLRSKSVCSDSLANKSVESPSTSFSHDYDGESSAMNVCTLFSKNQRVVNEVSQTKECALPIKEEPSLIGNANAKQVAIKTFPSSNYTKCSESMRDILMKRNGTEMAQKRGLTRGLPRNKKRRLSMDSLPMLRKYKTGTDQYGKSTSTFKLSGKTFSSILLPVVSPLDSIDVKSIRANSLSNSNSTPMVVVHSPAKCSKRSPQQTPIKIPPILESSFEVPTSLQTIMDSLMQTQVKSEKCDHMELEDLPRNDCTEMDTARFSPCHLLASSTPLNVKPRSRLHQSTSTVAEMAPIGAAIAEPVICGRTFDHPTPHWSRAAEEQSRPITNSEGISNQKRKEYEIVVCHEPKQKGRATAIKVTERLNELPCRFDLGNGSQPVSDDQISKSNENKRISISKSNEKVRRIDCIDTNDTQSKNNKNIILPVGIDRQNTKPSNSVKPDIGSELNVEVPINADILTPVEESKHDQSRAVFKTPDVIKSGNRLKHTLSNTSASVKFSYNDSNSPTIGLEQTLQPSESIEQLQMKAASSIHLNLTVKQRATGWATEPSHAAMNSMDTSPAVMDTRSPGTPVTSRKPSNGSKCYKRAKLKVTREEESTAGMENIKQHKDTKDNELIQTEMSVCPTSVSVVAEPILEVKNSSQNNTNTIADEKFDIKSCSQDARTNSNGENVSREATGEQGSDALDASTASSSFLDSSSTFTTSSASSTFTSSTTSSSGESFTLHSPTSPMGIIKPATPNPCGSLTNVKQAMSPRESIIEERVCKTTSVASSLLDSTTSRMCNVSLNHSLANTKTIEAKKQKPEEQVRFIREMRIVKENPKLMRVYIRRKGA